MSKISLSNTTVVVTGAAGFIGSYLSKNLLDSDSSLKIIGIDCITDYYDVSLKSSRQQEKPLRPGREHERGPRVREACRGSRSRRPAYLEKCRRLWIGDDQRGNENHAREVARPLRGREDADRAALREEGARAGRGRRSGSPRPRAAALEQAPSSAR